MEVKIALTRNGASHDVDSSSLKNWGDIMCSLTRSDYGGVVRKFTSQFDFIGEARRFLLGLYLSDGVEAQCDIAIFAMNDNWEFVKEFECPLDFSTIKWDDYVLSLSAVDNSLSAKLKAQRGVKHEMAIGEDIEPDCEFLFDRLPMIESAKYAFTQGESDETGAISVSLARDVLPWLGNIGSEVCVGHSVLWKDDQNPDDGGYTIMAAKDLDVELEWSVDIDASSSSGAAVSLSAEVFGRSVVSTHTLVDAEDSVLFLGGSTTHQYLGAWASSSSLPEPSAGTADVGKWALVGDTVWIIEYNGMGGAWRNTGKTEREQFSNKRSGKLSLSLRSGDKVRIVADWGMQALPYSNFKLYSSEFSFSWIGRGEPCGIPSFTAETVCDALLRRIAGDEVNVYADISGFDPRIANTRIMAAESLRGLPSHKLYTSFDDFCGWMETVFGYVYSVGEQDPCPYASVAEAGWIVYGDEPFVASQYQGEADPANIVYCIPHERFLYRSPEDGRLYISFQGIGSYMGARGPRADVVFDFANGGLKVFAEGDPQPKKYRFGREMVGVDMLPVRFSHRSELFSPIVAKEIANAKDISYMVDSSSIYSAVAIGYDKKDYEGVNGRDEFNFTNTYSTGSSVSDKTLTLVSKYRADSYGMEFAAQKRGEDTTDAASDQDVFFALCEIDRSGNARPDRSAAVSNVSDQVFNAAFSPMACARANAGYIGMQSKSLRLEFASAAGNSAVAINNEGMDSDIQLGEPLLTCGELSFSTDDQEAPANVNDAVRVVSNGIEYVGFIADLDLKYFRKEAAKYKLIVKSVNLI